MKTPLLEIAPDVEREYADLFTPEAKAVLAALARFEPARQVLMEERMRLRAERAANKGRISFLDPNAVIPRTTITVREAREGKFAGPEIPNDLKRQWIQGTGPAARPNAPAEAGLRNVAYALLSGADGWMFDGEDALGQVGTMSLDNLRNLKVATARDATFLEIAEQVAGEMNDWARGFLGGRSSTTGRRS